MATPTLKEIEDFTHSQYTSNYKAKLREVKMLDGKTYEQDYLKMDYLSMILPFQLDRVAVKPSKVHGKGVFATRDIKCGDLATFYPGDAVEYMPNRDRNLGNSLKMILYSRRMDEKPDEEIRNNDYAVDVNSSYTIFGDPIFDDNPDYVGHFINDGAKSDSTPQSDEIYSKISLLKSNCRFQVLKEGLHVGIVTTKDVKAGEELFIIYGLPYWKTYNRDHK